MKPLLTILTLLLTFAATAHAQTASPQNAREKARRYQTAGSVTPRYWSPGSSTSPRFLNGSNQVVTRPKIRYKRHKLRVVRYRRQYGKAFLPGQNTPRYYGARKPRKPRHTRYQTRPPQVRLRAVTPRFWNPSAGAARAGLR